MNEHMWEHIQNLLVASRFVNVDKNFKHFQVALLSSHADKCTVSFHLHNTIPYMNFFIQQKISAQSHLFTDGRG